MTGRGTARPEEQGQVTLLVIGFAAMLLLAVAMVVNASAAYLHRQALDNLADGAALHAADLGSVGVYDEGLPTDRLLQEERAVRAAVLDYLDRAQARNRFPGLRPLVDVDPGTRTVTVRLQAPADLPFAFPGTPSRPLVAATSTAAVTVAP